MTEDTPKPNADEPKPEEPQSLFDKLGAALPIALTALATAFASMSNGALNLAMYWKSQAAQDQSRAADQWSLAGFKRDRALIMQAAAAQLRANSGYAVATFDKPVPPPKDATEDASRKHAENQKLAYTWLTDRNNPPPLKLPDLDDEIKSLRDAIKTRVPERELLKQAGRMDMAKISKAIDDAEKANEQIDNEWTPIVRAAAERARAQAGSPGDAKAATTATAAQAAAFELEERRYRAEARANQEISFLYEIRTKVSTAESDKYRRKSDYLSYAMLVAQIGAVVSSLALARKRKSVLWLLASVVGIVAIAVGGYALIPPTILSF
jgi:hypothetical protein